MLGTKDYEKWQKLLADVWADPALKQRLIDDPAKVLAERDIKLPEGIQVRVLQDGDGVRHFVFPTRPASDELYEEELEMVAGGHCGGCRGCGGCGGCAGCAGCRGCGGCRRCRC